ncbi:AAA family ATPase [Bacillus inaquosorum]|uniref:ATP-dependent DNA helicase n=1 Tax=Bacillus inaquosorum TaxID=483913 RepID=UPI00227E387C|nr:AAA family ATPase [Bacillus inaquosorum]MCY9308733.1 AAA family ATPase [Bacillus inaquosorum]
MTKLMNKEELISQLKTQSKAQKELANAKEYIVQNVKPAYSVSQTTEPVKTNKTAKKRNITLTPDQRSVVDDIKRWFYSTAGYSKFELAGFAGVGKSTVVDFILEELDLHPDHVRMCAPTGQASLVLKDKAPDFYSCTLHKLFYNPERTQKGYLQFVPTPAHIRGAKLIIGDEFSMTGKRIAEEILPMARKAKVKVLIIGDPEQLPPVKDEDYFFKNPDAMLTQVLRQAADNPIIALSMAIRKATEEGRAYTFPYGNQTIDKKLYVRNRHSISIQQYAKVAANGGIVIAGTNKTRRGLNIGIRNELGFNSPILMNGEKVVIKENIEGGEQGEISVTNGMTGKVSNVRRLPNKIIRFTFTPDAFKGSRVLEVHEDVLFERATMADLKRENRRRFYTKEPQLPTGVEVLFGYCITAHASQGSQWDTVYLIDESRVFNRDTDGYRNQNRWLYTAVTRAKEYLVIAR